MTKDPGAKPGSEVRAEGSAFLPARAVLFSCFTGMICLMMWGTSARPSGELILQVQHGETLTARRLRTANF